MGEEEPRPAQCEYPQCKYIGQYRVPPELNERRFCIFHWNPENEEGKRRKAELFNQSFAKLVEEFEKKSQKEQEENPLDCRGFIFPARFSFFGDRKVSPAWFREATFGEGAWFGGATFGEGTWFGRATFGERASFGGATFGEGVSFGGATFGEGVSFDGARFGEDASFDGARFGEGATFFNAEFGKRADFLKAEFGKEVYFRRATFGEGASFVGATFGEESDFHEVNFLGSASFSGATIKGSLTFWGSVGAPGMRCFPKANEPIIDFRNIRLDQPQRVVFSSVNLEGASFLYTDISQVNFVDVSWPKDERGNIRFPIWEVEGSRATLGWLERLCQQLKLNYENKRNHAEAGEFHWAEMEYRRQRHWMNREWLPAVMLEAYKLLSGFGERIPRAAAVLFVSLLLAVFLQGRFGVFHAPMWVRPPGEAACVREDDRPFRILQDPPLIDDPCVDRSSPWLGAYWLEAYYQAGKFTLQDVTFQKPEEQAPASPFGRGLSLFMRLFFPIQIGLLLVAIKRRFRR